MPANWERALSLIESSIFKINTHSGSGTGFILTLSGLHSEQVYGLATAYHVIGSSHELEMPIRITHNITNTSILLSSDPNKRAIISYPEQDLAFIIFPKVLLSSHIDLPKIIPQGVTKNAGVEVGWCGFPNVAPNELCFFHGYISKPDVSGYLVDGVVIHGVSGGPAFYVEDGVPKICGVITQYRPNFATGQPLPGLGFVTSVEPYQPLLEELNTLDQAAQIAAEQNENISISPSPEPPINN